MQWSEGSRSRSRSRCHHTICAFIALSLLLGTAQAQPPAEPAPPEQPPAPSEPAPAPQPAPSPMPPPPPNYPPPPPYGPPPAYGYYQQPGYYPAAQPPRSPYRPFTLGLGLGVGMLSFRDLFGKRASEVGLSYTMRVGFGITSRWLVFLGAEGTGVNHVEAGVWQTAYLLGAQVFILRQLYLRAGIGLANSTGEDANDTTGQALSAVAGFEFAQGYSTSLAFELSGTVARYPSEYWTNAGVNFVLSFF
jgi:hypothetical protein